MFGVSVVSRYLEFHSFNEQNICEQIIYLYKRIGQGW
jgi:hypothetical protein